MLIAHRSIFLVAHTLTDVYQNQEGANQMAEWAEREKGVITLGQAAKLLKVSKSALLKTLKAQHIKLGKAYHPDVSYRGQRVRVLLLTDLRDFQERRATIQWDTSPDG